METLCTEDCTALLFATSSTSYTLSFLQSSQRRWMFEMKVIVNKLRITLLVPDNVSVYQHLNDYLKAVYFVREI